MPHHESLAPEDVTATTELIWQLFWGLSIVVKSQIADSRTYTNLRLWNLDTSEEGY